MGWRDRLTDAERERIAELDRVIADHKAAAASAQAERRRIISAAAQRDIRAKD